MSHLHFPLKHQTPHVTRLEGHQTVSKQITTMTDRPRDYGLYQRCTNVSELPCILLIGGLFLNLWRHCIVNPINSVTKFFRKYGYEVLVTIRVICVLLSFILLFVPAHYYGVDGIPKEAHQMQNTYIHQNNTQEEREQQQQQEKDSKRVFDLPTDPDSTIRERKLLNYMQEQIEEIREGLAKIRSLIEHSDYSMTREEQKQEQEKQQQQNQEKEQEQEMQKRREEEEQRKQRHQQFLVEEEAALHRKYYELQVNQEVELHNKRLLAFILLSVVLSFVVFCAACCCLCACCCPQKRI